MKPVTTIILFILRIYQLLISPIKQVFFGNLGHCRFVPSCSEYFYLAVKIHGPILGCWYGVIRLLKCHPFGGCGYDPVPEKNKKNLFNKFKK